VRNKKGIWYEIYLATLFGDKGTLVKSGKQVKGTELDDNLNPTGNTTEIDVDLVLDGGQTWAEVKNQGPMTTGSKRWSEFEDMVKSRFKMAKASGIDEFDFYLYNDKGGLTQDQIDLINEWSRKTGVKTKIVTDIKPGTIPSGSAWCQNTKTPQPPKPKTPATPTPTPTSTSSK
jgi:hypothetical protein